MSDDLSELQRRLEQITAGRDAAGAELDPESAELRAAWLAFGELLEADQSGVGSAARPLRLPPTGRRRGWPLAAVAAMAASVLVAVTVLWHTRTVTPGPAASGSPAAVAVKNATPPVPLQTAPARSAQPSSFVAGLSLDDPLDQQIASVGRTIVEIRQDQFVSAAGPSSLQYQLESVRTGIEASPFE